MKVDGHLPHRARQLLFSTLELLRKEIHPKFADWKDADDWLFAQLDITKDELQQIYKGRDTMVYIGSAVELPETKNKSFLIPGKDHTPSLPWPTGQTVRTTYKDRFDEVIQSGKYEGRMAKLKALTQLIYNNDPTQKAEDCVWQAYEEYEGMTGVWFDPTQEEFETLLPITHSAQTKPPLSERIADSNACRTEGEQTSITKEPER